MKIRNWLILGLALVLVAFTLTMAVPGVSRAQQTGPAASQGTAVQDYASGYYGYDDSGHAYRPMGAGYVYPAPATRNYWNKGSRARRQGYQGAWCPWNAGYARNYRGSRGYCW